MYKHNMSISDLLVANNYNLFANSVFSIESFSAQPNPVNPDQALNPVAATTIIFDNALVSDPNLHYSLATSIYTVPADGVYHFEANVQIQYSITLADDVSVNVQLMNGVNPLKISTSRISQLGANESVTVVLPLKWYGFCAAGNQVYIQAGVPTSLAHGSGNFSLYACNKAGSIFIGNRG